MKSKIIGRELEIRRLIELSNSGNPEFIAICGRRRVGKTFLIRQLFSKNLTFDLAGLANGKTKEQLVNFNLTLNRCFKQSLPVAANWLVALEQLISQLENSPRGRKIVFIDEISWLDTPRSNFLMALEHFWNGWACSRNDIMLIICGSATSWLTNKIINNHGGLHNRLTVTIFLQPFNLKESELFFQSQQIELGRQEIAEAYMIFGGIPYYLSLFEKGKSLAQNVDNLCFAENARLKNEFANLYASLFKNSDDYVKTVSALSKKNKGLTRLEIIEATGMISGKELTTVLKNLESCGFIRSYNALHKKNRDKRYQLLDSYSLFYFNFLEQIDYRNEHFWSNSINTPQHNAWAGYAFESLALQHIKEIKHALGISGIQSGVASWVSNKTGTGCQIDLLIDRKDGIINLCEMKFANTPYIISKSYEENLRNKIAVFTYESKTQKAVHLTFLTTFGIVPNKHSGLVRKEITLEDLFG
jgi:AAA+ ATPase superfamily predicted ATPase